MRRGILRLGGWAAVLLTLSPGGWCADRNVPGDYATIQAAVNAAQAGDRIVISGQRVEPGQITVSVDNLTFTSGATRGEVRAAHFWIIGSGVTFRDLDINGKNLTGGRPTDASDIVAFGPLAGAAVIEGCSISNPTPSDNIGNTGDLYGQTNPGTCVDFRNAGPITVRNCYFINDEEPIAPYNEVGLHFDYAPVAGQGAAGILVENCRFKSTNSNIRFSYRAQDIVIRGCDFTHPDIDNARDSFSAVAVSFNMSVSDLEGVIRDVLIENCVFNGPNDPGQIAGGIYASEQEMHNVVFRNNRVTPSMVRRSFTYWPRGSGLVIENNLFEARPTAANETAIWLRVQSTIAGSNLIPKGDPRLTMRDCMVLNNTFLCDSVASDGPRIDENYVEGVLVEGNAVLDAVGTGIRLINPPHAAIVRGNQVERSGGSGIWLAGKNTTVAGNVLVDCQNGIVVRESAGAYGSDTTGPQLDRASSGILLSRNIVLGSIANGMIDTSVDSGALGGGGLTWTGRSTAIRYVNNTVINSGSYNLSLRGDGLEVYNNLLVGGQGGVADYQGPGNANFARLGFNLIYQSPYRMISFPGGAGMAATDVSAFPLLAGGASPFNAAGVVPLPSSPAIDAGSANGVDPDYLTDIGAVEVGAVTDTSVPLAGWDRYR
ncbi:right-handed parallel beta-helix repeat-containing protein [bacterium]|nr:right-handed parallel beta-helix repeat-containing protein [bacterium]